MRFVSQALLLPLCLLAALRPTALAQNNAATPPVADDEVVRVDTNLVSFTASVRDRDGRFVTDLRQEDFIVTENGVKQQLSHFAPVEQPFSVVLLLDTSGSTRVRLQDIQDSAIAFVEQLRPHDRVLPITFDNEVITLLPDWTSDRSALRHAIQSAHTGVERAPSRTVRVKGRDAPVTLRYVSTHLYEAVHRAAELLAPVKGRKAIILLTDGFDTGSRVTFKSTMREAEELGALIYPVQYCDCEIRDARDNWSAKWEANNYLESLAGKSGGRFYRAKDMKKIRQAFASIAEELRHTYSLGYYPKPDAEGQAGAARQVKIKVTRPKLVVREGKSYVYQPPASVR
jgi:VWFA-related protein